MVYLYYSQYGDKIYFNQLGVLLKATILCVKLNPTFGSKTVSVMTLNTS